MGLLSLPADRNPGGEEVAIPPTGNLDAFHQTVLFDNNMSFAHYRVTFPLVKDEATANSMQIAEVEFLAVPEPATATLGCLAMLGLAAVALIFPELLTDGAGLLVFGFVFLRSGRDSPTLRAVSPQR